jgi:NosR/NirI family nitrous oxide reductase transcriptional regulator
VLLTLLAGGLSAHNERQDPAPGAQTIARAAAQADGQDPWGFDEPKTETWLDILRPQALDVVLLAAFLTLVLVGFHRKSILLKYLTLAAAVGYLGFVKSQLISVVDIFGLISWSLPIPQYNLAWYLLALFTVVSTILWGRLYCGRVCAFGALTQLLDAVVPRKLRVELPRSLARYAAQVKYVALAAVVAYFLATSDLMVYRFVEPFWLFGLTGMPIMWLGLGILLLATLFVRNLYCRFVCPVGAALGLLSTLTVFRIDRWSECDACRICEKTCEWEAIRGPRILPTECVRCDDCERLYQDARKCPHWLVPRRMADG